MSIPRSISRFCLHLFGCGVVLWFAGFPPVLRAQVPDTAAIPRDSVAVPVRADSSRLIPQSGPPRPIVGFESFLPGEAITDSIPALTPSFVLSDLLKPVPGSFLYAFGAPGWPESWSLYGLEPELTTLTLDGRSFDDPITGRPLFEWMPVGWLNPVHLGSFSARDPVAVFTRLRSFENPRPLTEIRYWKGDAGFQSIEGIHSQQRRRTLFGNPGLLGVTLGYGGRAAMGEYPGSRLRRERRVMGRIRYEQVDWSLELLDLYHRGRVGAQGGVDPLDPRISIYQRFGATVRYADARRQTIRNDLSLTYRGRVWPGSLRPLTISLYRTSQDNRFTLGANTAAIDTLQVRAARWGVRAEQDLNLSGNDIRLNLDGWIDHFDPGTGIDSTVGTHRSEFRASVADTLRLGVARLGFQAGVAATGNLVHPTAGLRFVTRMAPSFGYVDVSYTVQTASWVAEQGYGTYLVSETGLEGGKTALGRVGYHGRTGPFVFDAGVFGRRTRDAIDLFTETETADTVYARTIMNPVLSAGATLDVGWRTETRRGFYGRLQPTWTRILNRADAPELTRLASTLPELHVSGQFGMRYVLFRGDLDFDLYLRGRFWTSMKSRMLHPATGLLVVPASETPTWGPFTTFDVVMEARVRTATVFVAMDNFLSGTTLMPGNLIVPVYPLPQRRFRFGVYWPIFD